MATGRARSPAGAAAALVCLGLVSASAGGATRDVVWEPTPAEVAAYASEQAVAAGAPRASLKVAAARDAALRIEVLQASWVALAGRVPEAAIAEPTRPLVELGTAGTWRGVAYREILVAPLRRERGRPERLARLVLRIHGTAEPGPLPDAAIPGFASPVASGSRSVPAALPLGPAAPATRYRLDVSTTAIHRVDRAYLAGQGVPLGAVDPRTFKLTVGGVELPIAVEGESDGSFDPGDALVFYGEAKLGEADAIWNGGDFTDTRAYWLSWGGSPGLRMGQLSVAPVNGYPVVATTPATVRAEVNDRLIIASHLRPGGEVWFWNPAWGCDAGSFGCETQRTIDAPHAASADAAIVLAVGSFGEGDHGLAVRLNGVAPATGGDPAAWSGETVSVQGFTFAGALQPGANVLSLTIPGSAATADYQIPDYAELSYTRSLQADAGGLQIEAPAAASRLDPSGFVSLPLALDVTDRDPVTGLARPLLLTGVAFAGGTASLELGAAASTRRLALSASPALPDSVAPGSRRDLASLPGADLLVVAHRDFLGVPELASLVARRRKVMTVETVEIQEVYDAYSDGVLDPRALRAFLQVAATAWSRPPRYVLLVGDATYDYKDYLDEGSGDPLYKNWVPTMMVEDLFDSTFFGRYASDAWFADADADGYPDMAVGRLAVRSAAELDDLLTKVRAYEEQAPAGAWSRSAGYIADAWVEGWEKAAFEDFNDWLAATYTPSPYASSKVYFAQAPYFGTDVDLCAADIRAMHQSTAIIHYGGHGAIQSWGKYGTFFSAAPLRNGGTASDLDLLPVTTHNPFVIDATCYSNMFDVPATPGLLEEALSLRDRGPIGAAGPSTIANTLDEAIFSTALYDGAFGRPKVRRMGDLVEAGRFALPSGNRRGVESLVLLGDPSLALPMPAPSPPTTLHGEGDDAVVELSWDTRITQWYHVYRSSNAGVSWSRIASNVVGREHVDANVVMTRTYHYYVTRVDALGFEGAPSPVVAVTPTNPNPPAPPTGFTVKDTGLGGTLFASWSPSPEVDLAGYLLEWGTSPGNHPSSLFVAAPATSRRIEGLADGQPYFVVLRAVNTSQRISDPSGELTATPTGGVQVTSLHVERLGADLRLTWTKPQPGITGYRIYRVLDRYDWLPVDVPYGAGDAVLVIADPDATELLDAGMAAGASTVTYRIYGTGP